MTEKDGNKYVCEYAKDKKMLWEGGERQARQTDKKHVLECRR